MFNSLSLTNADHVVFNTLTHTHTQFKALFQPDPPRPTANLRLSLARLSSCPSICPRVSLSSNWQMELQRLRNWVWKYLPQLNSVAVFHLHTLDRPSPAYQSCLISCRVNWRPSPILPSSLLFTHSALCACPLNAQLPFYNWTKLKQTKKPDEHWQPYLPFPFPNSSPNTRIKLQNVLASKKKKWK